MSLENYQTLGESGLSVLKIIVGCMTFGLSQWADWVLDNEELCLEILHKCYKSGLTTFDTADVYSNGLSEIILGKFIKKYNIPRDKIVILTKCFFAVEPEDMGFRLGFKESKKPEYVYNNSKGLSRKHIFDAVKASVERLGTHIDVLQIHRLDKTPKKEIMKALNDVVDQGYAHYIGASSMKAYEFIELQALAEKNGWHQFISMQNYYNLLYREEEREMIPFCSGNTTLLKVTCIPWSPIARGLLARPHQSEATIREKSDKTFNSTRLNALTEADVETIRRVEKVASERGVSMANVAVAWVLHKGHCPIVGINSLERVDDTLKALELKLTQEEIAYLEGAYVAKTPLF